MDLSSFLYDFSLRLTSGCQYAGIKSVTTPRHTDSSLLFTLAHRSNHVNPPYWNGFASLWIRFSFMLTHYS